MKKFLIGLITFSLIIFFEARGLAHGVGYRQSNLKSIALEFFYSTGEKMSYREAKVFSPQDSKFAVQSGRTDEQGRFAFIPDSPGEWRVIVRDEEGHQCEAKINLSKEFFSDEATSDSQNNNQQKNFPEGLELFIRALLGVSLIFNAAFLIITVKRR